MIKLLALLLGAQVLLMGVLLMANRDEGQGQGLRAVGGGDNYSYSTTTRSHAGVALANGVLKTGPGALSAVVITGAAAGTINLYDATSTRTNTEWATTTLASFPASTAAGTYLLDASFSKGLYVEFVGSAPTTTVLWR